MYRTIFQCQCNQRGLEIYLALSSQVETFSPPVFRCEIVVNPVDGVLKAAFMRNLSVMSSSVFNPDAHNETEAERHRG